MKQCKVNGLLPCHESELCAFESVCGGATDYKTPHLKELNCLLHHVFVLAKELCNARGETEHETLNGYQYELLWAMRGQIAHDVKMATKWNEGDTEKDYLLMTATYFERIVTETGATFLREDCMRLKAHMTAHMGAIASALERMEA